MHLLRQGIVLGPNVRFVHTTRCKKIRLWRGRQEACESHQWACLASKEKGQYQDIQFSQGNTRKNQALLKGEVPESICQKTQTSKLILQQLQTR